MTLCTSVCYGEAMKKSAAVTRLEQKVKRLSSLIEVNAIIGSSLNLERILENVMRLSKQVMNADASSLMLIDPKTDELVYEVALGEVGEKLKQQFRLKLGQGIAGTVAQEGTPLLLADAYDHPKFYRGHDEATGYRTKSMITVPLKVGDRITGVAQVINRLDGGSFDQDDLELFLALCGLAAIAIENAKMHQSLMEKQRFVRDMEFARTVQESFLPQQAPAVAGYGFSAHYTPAQEVGGDFYDFIALTQDRIGVVIGDVSGKGVPAALSMAKLGSDLRTLAFTTNDPAAALMRLNDQAAERSRRGMFATVLYLELDARTGALTIANAGHLPPIVRRKDGTVLRVAPAGGSPIGILPGMQYGRETVVIGHGDLVVLYTDGVIEAMNRKEELYGYDRFEAIIRKEHQGPAELRDAIVADVNRFAGTGPQHDDLTLVCIGATA